MDNAKAKAQNAAHALTCQNRNKTITYQNTIHTHTRPIGIQQASRGEQVKQNPYKPRLLLLSLNRNTPSNGTPINL